MYSDQFGEFVCGYWGLKGQYIITTIGKSCSNSPIIRWRPETSCSSSICWSSQSWVWQQLGSLNRKSTNRQSKFHSWILNLKPQVPVTLFIVATAEKSTVIKTIHFIFLILIVKTIIHYDTCRTAVANNN